MSATIVEQGTDWAILWDGCVQCGAPAPCPKWIVGGTLTCELYPCLCDRTKAEAYELHGIDDPSCWWRDRKRGGRLASRCPCWGRVRDDRLPRGCCSWHEANPAHVEIQPDFMGTPVASTQADPAAEVGEAPERATTAGRTGGSSATGATASYRRLWPPSEVTCDCKTPWDGSKTAAGIHCVQCHENWKSASVMAVHQRWVTDRCRTPRSIVDYHTGRPLLAASRVGDFLVWNFDFSR